MIAKLDFSHGVIRDFRGVHFIPYLWFIVVVVFFNCLQGTWRRISQNTMKIYINVYSSVLFLPDNNVFLKSFLYWSIFFRATEQLTRFFPSALFCLYLVFFFFQITKEEAKVLFSQKKVHSLQLHHAVSWKAGECDNYAVTAVSQRAQAKGKHK